MNRKQIINDLIEFIDNSPVNYFEVKNSIEILEKNNFKKFINMEINIMNLLQLLSVLSMQKTG